MAQQSSHKFIEMSTCIATNMMAFSWAVYQKWVELNNFLLMLLKDAEKHPKDIHDKNQPHLNPHLWEKPQRERIIPYTNELFCDAAIEWLVSTDQVCKLLLEVCITSLEKHS